MRLRLGRPNRQRLRPIVTVLLLVALTLAVLDRAQPDGPVDAVTDYVRDVAAGAAGLWPESDDDDPDGQQGEIDRLQRQVAELQGQLATTTDLDRERTQLRELLELATPENAPKIAARVSSIGMSNYDSTVELSKGTHDGVEVGMPVLTGRGLVGRIVETTPNSSRVLVISDSTSNVGVRIGAGGELGVATGEGSGDDLRIDLVDLDSAIAPGDVAVTSGLQDSVFPPGIPVGTIRSVDVGPRDLRKTVKLDPSASLGKLDYVVVLKWRR